MAQLKSNISIIDGRNNTISKTYLFTAIVKIKFQATYYLISYITQINLFTLLIHGTNQ